MTTPRRFHTPYVASEKNEQSLGERLMAAVGFRVWRLSQARATMQTPGWCDVVFTAPGYCVAWEAKRQGGKQRPAQREFELAWRAALPVAQFDYVLGPSAAIEQWLIVHGYVERAAGGHLIVTRRVA